MADVNDEQLKQLLAAQELLNRLVGNKDTKREFERLAKKVNPQAVTTEDIAEPYIADLRKQVEELKEFKSTVEKGQREWAENESFSRLRKAGYTSEGIDAIKKIMAEKNVSDPEIAAAYWDKTRPVQPVAPNGISPSVWDFKNKADDDAEMNELLWKDEDLYIEKMAAKIAAGE